MYRGRRAARAAVDLVNIMVNIDDYVLSSIRLVNVLPGTTPMPYS